MPDITPPTIASTNMVDDKGGGPVVANELVTYTVTFSEDIDGATVSTNDFDNGAAVSPSTILYGAITEVDYGVFEVEIQPTTTGNLQLRIPVGASITDVSSNALGSLPILDDTTITVNADVTPPTIASTNIVDDQGGAPVTVSTLVLYTLTFSEDIDAATVSAADFSNAGTATLSFGTFTETSLGVFDIQVTPTTAGSLQLQIDASADIRDPAGNPLGSLPIPDDTTITVDGTPPTLANSDIVDNKGGGPVTRHELVTYTLTYSEDIDSNTVSYADFGNAGSASVTFRNIVETAPGVFTIHVQPTTAGTLQLQMPVGADIRDIAGNPVASLPIPDDTTISVDETPHTLFVPITAITAHHQGQNAVPGNGSITRAMDGSGMNIPDAEDPSTWARITGGWTEEWQSLQILNPSASSNNKIGWLTWDIGHAQKELQDVYLWNVAGGDTTRIKEFNLYYALTPTVTPPAPTGTATDYDFASGGWTKFNTTIPIVFQPTVTTNAQIILNLEGITAQHFGIEVITNYGNGSRTGLAEIGGMLWKPRIGSVISVY